MKHIVIFASGSGSNAENIIRHFQQSETARVVLVLSNKKDAKVLSRARALDVPSRWFTMEELNSNDGVNKILKEYEADLLVLAGFLRKVPLIILKEYSGKIVNIHPALLPKYGGKGMYGKYVHEAVVQNKETESGITIHFVNENYDEGAIIFQATVMLSPGENADSLAAKVLELEHMHYPRVIEKLIKNIETGEDPIG